MKFSWVNAIFFTLFTLVSASGAMANGKVKPRIIGGEDAASAPSWMAWIFTYETGQEEGGACGASLITSRWLITAAHCVEVYESDTHEILVLMGDTSITSEDAVRLSVDRVIVHPDYDPGNVSADPEEAAPPENDLALIRLSRKVDFEPLAIMTGVDIATLMDNDLATIYGWGVTGLGAPSDVLQTADMAFTTRNTCNEAWGGSVAPGSVCIQAPTQSACFGDSGGPMIVNRDEVDQLVGVASYVAVDESGLCAVGTPNVYMSPAFYFQWIAETVGLIGLDGTTDLGYVGVGDTVSERYRLVNHAEDGFAVDSIYVAGADSDVFTVTNNGCAEKETAETSCRFSLSVNSGDTGTVSAYLVVRLADGQEFSYSLSATFLPALAVDSALQINGGSWYSAQGNPWQPVDRLGSAQAPGFTSGNDNLSSVLLLHIEGPLNLNMGGRSFTSAIFDGVLVNTDNATKRWYRLDGGESGITVNIPSGTHRVAFIYDKQSSEGSYVGLFNFRTSGYSSSNDDDDDDGGSGGSLGISLLLLLLGSQLLLVRSARNTIRY